MEIDKVEKNKVIFKSGPKKRNIRNLRNTGDDKSKNEEKSEYSSVVRVPKTSKMSKHFLSSKTKLFLKVILEKKMKKYRIMV